MNDSTPGIGHNRRENRGRRRPSPIERAADLVKAANLWSKEVPAIRDQEQGGRAQDFVGQLREVKAELEAAEKAERKPHDTAVANIHVKYRDPLTLIGIAYVRLQGLLTPWLDKERDRIAAEKAAQEREADRLAQEANAAIERAVTDPSIEAELAARRATEAATKAARAAERPVERPKVKGELSSKATSLHTYWSGEVVDEAVALRHFAKNPKVRAVALAEIKRIVSKMARDTKNPNAAPPGCRFTREERAV
jgi:hypothetical protein